jgi:hypothetical protein
MFARLRSPQQIKWLLSRSAERRRGCYGELGRSSIDTDKDTSRLRVRSRWFEPDGARPELLLPQLHIGDVVEQIQGHSIILTARREK